MDICVILGPMRNGTSIFMASLFHHPEVFGFKNLSERLIENGVGSAAAYVSSMRALSQAMAWRERNYTDFNLVNPHKTKVFVDRTHIPYPNMEKHLNGSGFKVISLVRDPREVILSVLKWHKKPLRNPNNIPEGKYISGFMKAWQKSIDFHMFLKTRGNDAMLFRHEDLCKNTKEEFAKVYEWLNISPDESAVNAYRPASSYRDNDDSYKKYMTPTIVNYAKSLGYEL